MGSIPREQEPDATNLAAALSGYIKRYRKLRENPIWTQCVPAVLKVAIYFLLRANHKPRQLYISGAGSRPRSGAMVPDTRRKLHNQL
jgi:hypothetical protein